MKNACAFCHKNCVNPDNPPYCYTCTDLQNLLWGSSRERANILYSSWIDVASYYELIEDVQKEHGSCPFLWILYWNYDRTAVCIELRREGTNTRYYMLSEKEARNFVFDPKWKEVFVGENLSNVDKQQFTDLLEDLLGRIHV